MKKIITFFLLSTLMSLTCIAQTATVRATNGINVSVYTKAGTDNADTAAKKNSRTYADQKAAAAQAAAIAAASADATKKANAAQAAAISYADKKFLEGYDAGLKSADSLFTLRLNNVNLDSIVNAGVNAKLSGLVKSFSSGSGIKLEEIATDSWRITGQFYWDAATSTIKRNF